MLQGQKAQNPVIPPAITNPTFHSALRALLMGVLGPYNRNVIVS